MSSMLYIPPSFFTSVPKQVSAQTTETLRKLQESADLPGLHVEPMQQPADARVRTVRVNDQFRMVVFKIDNPDGGEPTWIPTGVYNHDDAIKIARSSVCTLNPATRIPEIRSSGDSEADFEARLRAHTAKLEARHKAELAAARSHIPEGTAHIPLEHYDASHLVSDLGIDHDLAYAAVKANEVQLEALIDAAEVPWQAEALLALAVGDPFAVVLERYAAAPAEKARKEGEVASDRALLEALATDTARSTFAVFTSDDDLQRVLESGDFEAWRLFLHPEQRRYVTLHTRGPYRLTGGAGTGKTVVLVHRTVELARRNPEARIIATTFTTNLAEQLRAHIQSLDPDVRIADNLGDPGIFIANVDQLATHVVRPGADLSEAMREVLGWSSDVPRVRTNENAAWSDAVASARLRTPIEGVLEEVPFLTTEYASVILPFALTSAHDYMRASRKGRGAKLGRKQRAAMWNIIEAFRDSGQLADEVTFTERIAIATRMLDLHAEKNGRVADHVLVDETQDLDPVRLVFLRALVAEGPNDMFLAGDEHQRIYSTAVRPSHYGINIRGRSRRLRLNYRTTAQNLNLALSILDGGDYSGALDSDEAGSDELTTRHGSYRSLMHGPAPEFIGADTLAEEFDRVAEVLRAWREDMGEGEHTSPRIGILTRTKTQRDNLVRALEERGLRVQNIDRGGYLNSRPAVMTLHRSKGTEFERVILFGIDDQHVPYAVRGYNFDPDGRSEAMLRERSLLYVGATRARERLLVTWTRQRSAYLPR
ncbi:UvrD-helicase domain-containing protein [Dermabacter sp. Marseille-Q3180]|uniref:UvrD-helicase domain-containing protein n=1 Tax=Dermabacter sp. Marseille-Q3180 TaxID=2758090 RepID=UPI002024570E|nr:UvrD-helicase domain-containing protein [Dermabacter sp. Marseille-Q3180]